MQYIYKQTKWIDGQWMSDKKGKRAFTQSKSLYIYEKG